VLWGRSRPHHVKRGETYAHKGNYSGTLFKPPLKSDESKVMITRISHELA